MLRPSASLSARAVGAEVTVDVGGWASVEAADVRLDEAPSGLRRQAAAVAAVGSGVDTEEENRPAGSLLTYQPTG